MVPAPVFSLQSSEIFNSNFFKEDCYKKKSIVIRNVDQISITNLIPHFLLCQDFCISAQVRSLWERFIYSFISRKKSLKVVNNIPTIGLWRSLICQNSDADIYSRKAWLISMHCSQKTFYFLNVSTSILSNIVITLRKSHEIIFVGYFWKIRNTWERYFWDVSVTK